MFNQLINKISEYKSAVLGFSGGVDSSLMAYALKSANMPYICATVQTPLQSKSEIVQSAFFCSEYGIKHEIICLDVLKMKDVKTNSKDRCYYCKKNIFGALFKLAKDLGYETVMDGSNADDLKEYRPGLKAKDELGVISPLAELGLGKKEIRSISKDLGLKTWNMPSSPCLATRIPYGTALNIDVLSAVEKAEELLVAKGMGNVRVRVHGDIARIEAQDKDKAYSILSPEVLNSVKDCGFKYVCLDMDGYKRGCFD